MTFKLALVQPKTYFGKENDVNEKNLKSALNYIDEASENKADIICLPETYPGPWRKPVDWTPIPALQKKAKEKSVYILAGTAEKSIKDPEKHNIVMVIINRDGEIVGKYRRTTPPGPWAYPGGKFWDLDYEEADELPVFETEFGKIGILMCSEVYVPELARILALKGAEILFMPAGGVKVDLNPTWRTLIFARAIENLAYNVTTQNIFGVEEGLAMVTSPEEIILEEKKTGVYYADIDLERVRWLRKQKDKIIYPLPYKTKPGTLDQWRREEIYSYLINSQE
ncbi:MAG TPA: carbon-nitrogen hydrolase family protein [Halanaerobiales bacterium]|nr:carbon-nitrogen hydrolase family protein [Halanaerobiales bacterium]